jgi:nicotinate-nucleotide adenylyltransferase
MLGAVRTGILGGTFDPIHIAHLHAGETARDQGNLDRVLYIPAGDPWQKAGRAISPAQHRVEMVRLAIEGVAGFELDTREVDRTGPTYTIDTLETFPGDEELSLILGADAASALETWHRHEEVLGRAEILVVPRPGADAGAVVSAMAGARLLDMAPLGVSGTLIRTMAAEGRPFRYLVPEPVWEYVEGNNLYAKPAIRDSVRETTETESSS